MKVVQGEVPKIEDGCVIQSWRCRDPNREDQKESLEQRMRSKVCPVCKMVYCQYHMSEQHHMADCNFRSNQERVLLAEQRLKAENEKQKKIKEAREKEKANKAFEEKEKIRRANIAERNRLAKTGG